MEAGFSWQQLALHSLRLDDVVGPTLLAGPDSVCRHAACYVLHFRYGLYPGPWAAVQQDGCLSMLSLLPAVRWTGTMVAP